MPQYNILDLFSGCGGMSLGFEMAGFSIQCAIEKDLWAAQTYHYNHPNVQLIVEDITQIEHTDPCYQLQNIFGIIGGPPCQGFSLSGHRDPKDPRNTLFMNYLNFVNYYQPSFFVMENVPGILSAKTRLGEHVKDVILNETTKINYNTAILLLNAVDYGVPQARQRVFFIGINKNYPFDPLLLYPKKIFQHNPITIREALSDLPHIEAGQGSEEMNYATLPQNNYQQWCREKSLKVYNHIAMKHTKRIIERFKTIHFGQSAADVPSEHMQRKRGEAHKISGKIYAQNNMRPYPDLPSPTIPASFQSNFVHPLYNRNYTAREGARLQSFPDDYIFQGKRTTMSWEKNLSQYQQIGNAVPPLLAKAIAQNILIYFNQLHTIQDQSQYCHHIRQFSLLN